MQHTGGALIYANEAAARMLGYDSAQELLSTPVDEIVNALRLHEGGRLAGADRGSAGAPAARRRARPQAARRAGGRQAHGPRRLARDEGLRRVRLRRRAQARRQRHRGHHRGQARRARPAHAGARRRAAVLVAGLRAHAAAGRRAGGARARRLVHGEHARRRTASSVPSPSRTSIPRRSRSRGASASATRRAPTRRPASRSCCATAGRSSSTTSRRRCSRRSPRTTSTSSC